MQPNFTTKKGKYTKEELGHLSIALGFPRTLLLDSVRFEFDGLGDTEIKETTVLEVLQSKALDRKLEKTFNRFDAVYNVKLIIKGIDLLRRRSLTFRDLCDARVSFEVYSSEDGLGMAAEVVTVQLALKLVNRIMSPLELRYEIQKYQEYSEIPFRLQMYEFFDLVSISLTWAEAEKRFQGRPYSDAYTNGSSNADIDLPDFGELLKTNEQRILDYLDDEYKASLYNEVEPRPPTKDAGNIIHNERMRSLVSLSREGFSAIIPHIDRSAAQLRSARNGRIILSPEQHSAVTATMNELDFKHQKPLKFRFRGHLKKKNQVALSQTIINSCSHRIKSSMERFGFKEVESGIDELCSASVVKARDALRSSFALLQPLSSTKMDLPIPITSPTYIEASRGKLKKTT